MKKKITELTAVTSLAGTEVMPVVQSGSTKKATVDQVKDYVRPYKVYVAVMSQSGTSAPSATVLENTIGSIAWTRTASGTYQGRLTSAFTSGKVFLCCQVNAISQTGVVDIIRVDADNINLLSTDMSYSAKDDIITDTSIEIRVYS